MSDTDADRYALCRHCAKTVREPLEPGPHIHTESGDVLADWPFLHRAEPERQPSRKLVFPKPPQPKGGPPPS